MPTEQHHKVAHASLNVAPSRFLLRTDYIPREHRDRLILSPCILASDELKAVFDHLAVGASKEPLDDLRDMPFGSYDTLPTNMASIGSSKGTKLNFTPLDLGHCEWASLLLPTLQSLRQFLPRAQIRAVGASSLRSMIGSRPHSKPAMRGLSAA